MRLKEFRVFIGELECITPLHIGAGKDELEIGGVDGIVIKNPINGEPYIPGSSLKGRMRSLLEKRDGRISKEIYDNNAHKKIRIITEDGTEPCSCGENDCIICTMFGAHKNNRPNCAPTRMIVRDAFLTEECKGKQSEFIKEKSKSFLEIKAENIINRKTSVAEHPRFFERVPAGTKFAVELVLQVYDTDDVNKMVKTLRDGIALVENTYLGGQGSRGYGKVKFHLPEEPEIRPA